MWACMRNWMIAGLAVAVSACAGVETPAPDAAGLAAEQVAEESRKLTAYLNAEYEEELREDPMQLTQMGRKELYGELGDFTDAAALKRLEWRRGSVAGMKASIDPAKLDDDAKISWAIWENELDLAELRSKWRRNAYVFGFSGPHTGLPNFLITYHKVDEPADLDAYISRLSKLGGAIDQATERAKLGVAAGVRMPKFGYERTASEAQNVITGAPFGPGADSPLWADVKAKTEALKAAGKLDAATADAKLKAAEATLTGQAKPAYERLIAWLKSDMGNAPSGKVGALTLPNGVEWYKASLKLQTTTGMTADEIHELGLSEVKRIHGEMDKIRVATGFKGDMAAFLAFMRTDKQFYLPDTDEGRAEYLAKAQGYLDAMYKRLPEYFGRLPKAPLIVKRVEAFREVPGGAAHYYGPTPDGKQPGIFYAHLIDMSAVSLWALESLSYHEGVPGHHMQIAIQNELTDIPTFRTQYGYTAYIEGWGLYAEDLGKEMGMFTDPYNDFGRLNSELWRSVRLVLDSGLHAEGWTEDEAVAWAMANSARPESSIKSEVRRFLLWPGQATAYKIGMIRIQELRAEAEKELGDRFDIRAFHDTVIGGGSMPLPVLEQCVKAWVARVKAEG
jgi:uncharacterized protein (DUF885 family)